MCAVLLAAGLAASVAADAAELALAAGHGDGVRAVALAIRSGQWNAWQLGDDWSYDVAGEWQLARWSANVESHGVAELIDGSATVVLALRPASFRTSYVEGGFGVHMLSDDRIGADRDLGWRFQFGEFIGAGIELDTRQQYAIGLRIQHVSNGSLKPTNDGVTFVQGLVRCSF